MKDVITDANFPKTDQGRVYHLGIKPGDLANRIVTVGDPSRALKLSKHFDVDPNGESKVSQISSERGFLTLTGTYKGVPMSIVAIGMGFANMDFFVREGRECVSGDMYIIRFGSCGCLTDLPVGSIVAPRASVAVTRNYDFDFTASISPSSATDAYRISKPAIADPILHEMLVKALNSAKPSTSDIQVRGDYVNASADSFYSSQGRITSFPDHNESLIDDLLENVEGLATLEMETFHLLHLAAIYPTSISAPTTPSTSNTPQPPSLLRRQSAVTTIPPTSHPAPNITGSRIGSAVQPLLKDAESQPEISKLNIKSNSSSLGGGIHACAAQMVFAERASRAFITPEEVQIAQGWGGLACLEALTMI